MSDPQKDAGLQAPEYADVRSVRIETNGASARITVTMWGVIPSELDPGEVEGIGVDLTRHVGPESDYQLFADGSDEGWLAYLDTPRGFVKYRGTFALGGTGMVFVVPWSALGGKSSGRFSAFADWSGSGENMHPFGEDAVPTAGTEEFAP